MSHVTYLAKLFGSTKYSVMQDPGSFVKFKVVNHTAYPTPPHPTNKTKQSKEEYVPSKSKACTSWYFR
jgi:hypothetical protein